MASKTPTKTKTQDAVEIVIETASQEDRKLELGGQQLSFKAPMVNVLELKAKSFIADVDIIEVTDDGALMLADETLRSIKGAHDALDRMRKSVSDPLYQAWKANNDIYKPPMELLEGGRRKLEKKIAGYHEEVARRAAEEQRRREREAEAERQRLAAEAAALQEQAELAAISGDEGAEELFQQAEATEIEAAIVVAETVDTAPAKIAGSSIRYAYGVALPTGNADKIAALKYLLANPQFLNLVTFDQKACNQLATALKDNFAIPGLKLEKKPIIAQRGVRSDDNPFS